MEPIQRALMACRQMWAHRWQGHRWRRNRILRFLFLLLLSFSWVLMSIPAKALIPEANWDVQARPALLTAAPATASVSQLLDQGKQEYEQGQTQVAIATWKTAATQAQAEQQYRDAAIAHNYLAMAHQDLSQWQSAQVATESAIAALDRITPETVAKTRALDDRFLRAQILNTRGAILLHQGQADKALTTWQTAEVHYRSVLASDPKVSPEFLVRNQLNQVQAMRSLGFYRRAKRTVDRVSQTLRPLPDSRLKLRGLQSLGGILRLLGEESEAETVLREGLAIAQRLDAPIETQALKLSLAQTLAQSDLTESDLTKTDSERAFTLLDEVRTAAQVTTSVTTSTAMQRHAIEAALAQIEQRVQQNRLGEAARLARTVQPQLRSLPPNRWSLDAQIQFAHIWLRQTPSPPNAFVSLKRHGRSIPPSLAHSMAQLLSRAAQQAEALADQRSQSYALGTLGQLYEQSNQPQDALTLTRQALQLAQQLQSPGLLAQWQWQQGRLLAQQQQPRQARASYSRAFEGLEDLQQDLVSMGADLQFSFRQEVEPAYRQYVQLLLQDIDSLSAIQQQDRLQRARQVMEALQLAELQNYFRQACLTYDRRDIETIDPEAAVLYPILLDNSLEVILSLPNQPLRHYRSNLPRKERQQLFEQFYAALNAVYSPRQFQQLSQQLYRYLVAPAAEQLAVQSIKTLVFVSDSGLRNFPMAALYDGDRYLIESYRVALSPGLQLLNSQPLQSRDLNILSAGLTEARQGFLSLPAVKQELANIQAISPSQTLLNQRFSQEQLKAQLATRDYPVVHLATHGKFSSRADETFLVTWDGRITANQLDQLFQRQRSGNVSESDPLELLVLSACQTAAGDRRAALGMAGVAVRSGARSTLATLWAVNDQSTALFMSEFYRLLIQEQLPRGEAVRQAQLSLLKQPQYRRPYYWAPFVLVGNWQ